MQRILLTVFISLLASVSLAATSASARDAPLKVGDMATILATDLPKQGRETLILIRKGGPFPYAKDGVVFGNRERILPGQPRGFYKEFTVKTPGSRDRGARRIICGGELRDKITSVCFYSDDHYRSFKRIKE